MGTVLHGAPQRHRIEFDDGTQSYLEWAGPGEGAPVVHFAHANGFNAYTYHRLLAPLAARARVLAIDMRGHGETGLPADPARHKGWTVYRDDLIRFLERKAERPVILAGHSMGGLSSLLVAEARPDLVEALVLVDPVIFPRTMYWRLAMGRRFGLSPSPMVEAALKRRAVWPDRPTMVRAYKGRGAFATWPEETIADYVAGGTQDRADGSIELACAPAWEAANFATAAEHSPWGRLTRVACPVRILRGTERSTCPAAVAQALAARIPACTERAVAGASHFLPMEFPALIRGEIADMLDHL